MMPSFHEIKAQIYSFPRNKLVFKQATPTHPTDSKSLKLIPRKNLFSSIANPSNNPKNLLKKRSEIREKFGSSESKQRQLPLTASFKVVGHSENTEKLKNSYLIRKNYNLSNIRRSQTLKKLSKTAHLKVLIPSNSHSSLNSPSHRTRRVVPVISSSLDLTEIEDHDEEMIIKSRYF